MKEELEKLKSNGKLKEYGKPIPEDQMVFIGDLLCSYAIEDNLVKQGILTISHKERHGFDLTEEFQKAIAEVFGDSPVVFKREYPNRGRCIQFAFGRL